MNDLAAYQGSLPETAEDLAHFLLIAPEKAAAMRAEIRAIQKVGLAKAVYDQKLEEQRRLCDMILDASVRLGEMTKAIPQVNSNQHIEKLQRDSDVLLQKTKTETIEDLGFSKKQVQRFETLADNKDLVEQEKAQAREEGRMPTRTNVINLAQERKKRAELQREQLDRDFDNLKLFRKAVSITKILEVTDEVIDSVAAVDTRLDDTIQDLNDLIGAIIEIRDKLIQKGAGHGKKQRG